LSSRNLPSSIVAPLASSLHFPSLETPYNPRGHLGLKSPSLSRVRGPKIGEFNLLVYLALRIDVTLFYRLGEVYILVSLIVVFIIRELKLVRCYNMFGSSSVVDV
jgi:hypothetical protein